MADDNRHYTCPEGVRIKIMNHIDWSRFRHVICLDSRNILARATCGLMQSMGIMFFTGSYSLPSFYCRDFSIMSATLLLIESARTSAPSFASALKKRGYSVLVYHKTADALAAADLEKPDLIILDAASMRTSGQRMCRKMHAHLDSIPIILVAPAESRLDPGNGASLTLRQPFTPRKILNRIARLLPGDETYLIKAGPICLNLANRTVRCLRKKSRLTPKQAKLLETFIRKPGRLFTRKTLIKKIWHTDYTGDTRTLDVHMSWLRKAIEPDQKHPRFLKTIRGVGYRLDIPDED